MKHRAKLLSILSIALPFLLFFQTYAASATSSQPGDVRADDYQSSTLTFSPSPIPMSDAELVNPMRGLHTWQNNDTIPQPDTSPDAYKRYYWRDPDDPDESLETSRGVYNFAMIDADIAAAAAQGQKFAFRLRAMGNDSGGKRYVPDYMSSCGWSYRGTFVPDWNRSCFLDNAQNLVNALGRRYNNDPRIAWVDIGLYGRWGEWAMTEDIYNSAPSGVSVISDGNMRRIVDMHLDAFPDVRKVMFAKTRSVAVVRALSSSDQVGWRIDCLGKDGYFDFATNRNFADSWALMQDRWKTAPVIVEFCASGVEPTYSTSIQQVRDYHISTIGNGNIDTWNSKSSTQKANLTTMGKTAGYRFKIKDVTVPSNWTRGSTVNITARWENVGVAPHYEATNVKYMLYNTATSSYVWDARSSINLRDLLPTNGNPVTIRDNLSLPSNLAAGSYQLRVKINDPAGYRQPLKLAVRGRQSDGSYLLGTITVGSGSQPAPSPEPSQTITFNPIADTYVSSSAAGENYGGRNTVRSNNSPTEIAYLRFDLRSLACQSISEARLRVRVSNGAAGHTTQNVKNVSSDSWNEDNLTFNNRPGLSSSSFGAFHGGGAGDWINVELTDLIRSKCGQVFSLAVRNNDADSFAFYTRESSDKPQLNVTVEGADTVQGDSALWLPGILQ